MFFRLYLSGYFAIFEWFPGAGRAGVSDGAGHAVSVQIETRPIKYTIEQERICSHRTGCVES